MVCFHVYMLRVRQIDTSCAYATEFSEWIMKFVHGGKVRTWFIIIHRVM